MMKTQRPLLVQFGAGNIGRSLVGTLFSQAGYDIVFVDAAEDIVTTMQKRHAYRVVIKDNLPAGAVSEINVPHVDALDARDTEAVAAAVARADLIGTAVGANVLPIVLKNMAAGLARRTVPVSILFCENMHGAPELARNILKEALPPDFDLEGRIGLIATSIGKMVPIMPSEVRRRDPLEVWGEAYNIIIADAQAFVGPTPEVSGLELKSNFQAYVDRKLYVHNLGHAVCACHGFLHGCDRIAEAMEVPDVAQVTRAAMEASAAALIKRYPDEFTPSDQHRHVEDLLRRFRNLALGDTVYRVGRDLPRKLSPNDRFVGALKLVAEQGGPTQAICDGIAAALLFAAADEQGHPFPPDTEVRQKVANEGVKTFLMSHAGLDENRYGQEIACIEQAYSELSRSSRS